MKESKLRLGRSYSSDVLEDKWEDDWSDLGEKVDFAEEVSSVVGLDEADFIDPSEYDDYTGIATDVDSFVEDFMEDDMWEEALESTIGGNFIDDYDYDESDSEEDLEEDVLLEDIDDNLFSEEEIPKTIGNPVVVGTEELDANARLAKQLEIAEGFLEGFINKVKKIKGKSGV